MDKPRIFIGLSAKQQKLLQALTRGFEGVADVVPWTGKMKCSKYDVRQDQLGGPRGGASAGSAIL